MDLALGIAVVIATFAGPVFAVLVTRHIDNARQVRDRRLNVFRTLMATRRTFLSPEKVIALNMVEIEFYGIRTVQDVHRDVMAHINAPRPLPQDWEERHRTLLTRLLSEIAKVLGYQLQQLDVLEGGYYPQGLADIEVEQQAVRRADVVEFQLQVSFADEVSGILIRLEMPAQVGPARKSGTAEDSYCGQVADHRIADIGGFGGKIRLVEGATQ